MKVIKKTDDCTVYQKRSGRYAVMGSNKKLVNGEEKTKILIAEGIVKIELPKEPEPEVEVAAAESTDDKPAADASAEETTEEKE